ncbi:hypothetical protein [Nonomuraea sp. NPDC049480]|uniref:hypothetical protein n=1 Tax=Nonomuraea sp. NPDC049480 TaxID=3364353 RepID=UPI00378AF2A8
MGSGGSGGYQVAWQGLRKRSARAGDDVDFLVEQRDILMRTFEAEGNPLGKDQYGVELERNLPKVKQQVFDAFDVYIDEMEYLRDGLSGNARYYEEAEDPWSSPGGEAPPAYETPRLSEDW